MGSKQFLIFFIGLVLISCMASALDLNATVDSNSDNGGGAIQEVIYPSFGVDFKLFKSQTAVLENYKISLLKTYSDSPVACAPSTGVSCIIQNYAVLEVSKKSNGDFVSQLVYIKPDSKQSVFGISIQAHGIDSESVVLTVFQESTPPAMISPNLGEEFKLLPLQQANVQKNSQTVMKLILERIDNLGIACITTPCPTHSAVMTASLANAGIVSFKVRVGESATVGNYSVAFLETDASSGKFIAKEQVPEIPETIYPSIGEYFKLFEKQKAIFNEAGISIVLQGIERTATCTAISCPPSEVVAKLTASRPQGELSEAIDFSLKSGESKEIFNYIITSAGIASDEKSAKFVLNKKEQPVEKTAYLNEKFKLAEKETAVVWAPPTSTCYENGVCRGNGGSSEIMKVKLLSIEQYKCVTETTAVSSTAGTSTKCIGSQPFARVQLSYSSGQTATGTEAVISEGSSVLFNGFELAFLDSSLESPASGVFIVKKPSLPEYIKVNLNENFGLGQGTTALIIGEDVFVKLNSSDSKSSVKISVWKASNNASAEYLIKVGESVKIYGIGIKFLGFRLDSGAAQFLATKESNPEVINVHINEPFKLLNGQAARVLEANLRIDVLGIQQTFFPSTCPSNVETCNQPAPKYSVEFTVSNYAFEKTEIGKAVASSVMQETVVETAASATTAESSSGGGGSTAPIELPPMPWKAFTLQAGESVTVGDFEIQVLRVNSELAEFEVLKKSSGETFSFVLKTGWNLFSMPGVVDTAGNDCESSSFKLFEYNALEKKFDAISEPVAGKAYWLYNSGKSCEAKATIRTPVALSELPALSKGWNFVAVVPEMIGSKITELGNCKIKSAFAWNASSKKWENVLKKQITQANYGTGLAVFATEACSLSGNGNEFPPMPDVPGSSSGGSGGGSSSSSTIQAVAGETFVIKLESHSDGGYSWNPGEYDDSMVTHVSNDKDLSSCAEGVVGCSGFDIFTFKALKAGETSITLKECRLWDCEATTTLKTFNVVIKKGNIDPSVCNDSDNGKKYYVKGTISGPTAEGGYVTSYDQCEGNVLSEWYCEGNYISSEGFEKYTCPKGCNNGACIE